MLSARLFISRIRLLAADSREVQLGSSCAAFFFSVQPPPSKVVVRTLLRPFILSASLPERERKVVDETCLYGRRYQYPQLLCVFVGNGFLEALDLGGEL